MRLDLLLIRRHPGLSRRRAREAIEKGQVDVDGAPVREPGLDVAEDADVAFDANRKALPRARIALPLLHEDEHVLVVDKPAGLLSVPAGPGRQDEDTALGRVREYARRLRPRGGYAERVHRLDRDTSGALAFALSHEARARLIDAFSEHRIERRYLAIVVGVPAAEAGTIDAPVRDAWLSGRRGVARQGEPQRPARTHYRLRERFAGAALVELALETGRQHQVRVHLAHVGLPILGDPVYGAAAPGMPRAARPMLHAVRLGFAHPITGAPVVATSPLPADFEAVLKQLRKTTARGDRAWTDPKPHPSPRSRPPERARHSREPGRGPSRPPSRRASSSPPRPPRPPRTRRRSR
jgi:23S rRNA pseudouridine1911/1915/1917 synthase